jgi:hypothetical protein
VLRFQCNSTLRVRGETHILSKSYLVRVQLSLQRGVLMVASRDKTDLHEGRTGGNKVGAWRMSSFRKPGRGPGLMILDTEFAYDENRPFSGLAKLITKLSGGRAKINEIHIVKMF